MSETTLVIGKPNYNRSSERTVYHRLGMKDNQRSLTVFIAPPVKSCADTGEIAVYCKQHFGYTFPVKDKSIPAIFSCIEQRNRQDKSVTQECPECNERNLRKAQVEAKKESLKSQSMNDAQIEATLRPQNDWLKAHNLDRKWNLLAKSEAGVWGVLALSLTAYNNLLDEVKKLREKAKIEPIGGGESGLDGIWFTFTRTGEKFNEIEDKCEPTRIYEGVSSTLKTYTLTPEDLRAIQALPDLKTLGRRISYEQIRQLVESGGDEAVVKAIFDSSQKRSETSPHSTASETVRTPVNTSTNQSTVVQPTTTVKTAPATTAAAPAIDAGALQAQIAALQAQLAAGSGTPVVAPQTTTAATKTTAESASPKLVSSLEMDPDQFLEQFGN